MSKKDELQKEMRQALYTLELPASELEKAKSKFSRPVAVPEPKGQVAVQEKPVATVETTQPKEGIPTPVQAVAGNKASNTGSTVVRQSDAVSVLDRPKTKVITGPKFATLDRIDIRFRNDQIKFLTDIELTVRQRNIKGERITKASIVRAVVDLLPHLNLDFSEIPDEGELRRRILSKAGVKGS